MDETPRETNDVENTCIQIEAKGALTFVWFFFYLRNLHRNERRRQLLRSILAMFTQMCFNGGFEILVSFFKLWRKIREKNELDFYIKRIVFLFLSKRIYDADVRTKQMDLNLENTTRYMDFVITCDINSICGGF